jgi:hypothetical protein
MEVPNNLNFAFKGKLISNTSSHVENIAKTISKQLGVLRKFKFKFKMNRQNLEKMYLVYIRPIFEYVCEVWENCGTCQNCKGTTI